MPDKHSTSGLVSLRSDCVPPARLGPQHRITALWRPLHDGTEYGSVAAKAYEDAVAFCNREFKPKDRQMWLNGKNTIKDLKDVIDDATNRAPLASKQSEGWRHRAMEAWRSLSATIHHYGAVMDVLVQHHPEYVSLAWGAFKFLFLITIRYEELKCNIAEALVKIGELLMLIEGWTSLYQIASIQAAASKLYRHIILFCLKATGWARKTRGLRILRAIAKPWAVDFEQCVQAINDECRMIRMWAQLALSAEIRDMNFQRTFAASNVTENLHFLSHPKVTVKLPENPVFSSVLRSLASAPTSQESLQVGKSLRDLRRARGVLPASVSSSPCLRAWAEESKSAILYANGNFLAREGTKDFVVDMIQLAMTIKIAVVWSFNARRKDDTASTSAAGIVRSLIQQMLVQLPDAAATLVAATSSSLQDSGAIEELLKVFVSLVDIMPKLLIVVEVNDLLAPGIKELSRELKSLVNRESPSVVKVIVVSYHRDQASLASWVGNGEGTYSIALEERRGLRNSRSSNNPKIGSLGARAALADGVGKLKPYLLRSLK